MPAPRLLPMLASPGRPGDATGDDWVHEFKWDGVRALLVTGPGQIQLRSRAGNDITGGYPELAGLADVAPPGTVLDGEVVALDDHGVPSFPLLQRRMHVRDPVRVADAVQRVPVRFLVFDVLVHAGEAVMQRPWTDRRAVLEGLGLDGPHWATPPVVDDLGAALQVAEARHLEGVVSKRRTSVYRPGERSPDWRKLRLVREADVVVGGWRHGQGHRAGTFGSLLVGAPEEAGGALRFAGSVGSGFTDREATRLRTLLEAHARADPPFEDAPVDDEVTWCDPEIVVRVRYREVTPDHRLRQPSYRGQRTDVDPDSVEPLPSPPAPRYR